MSQSRFQNVRQASSPSSQSSSFSQSIVVNRSIMPSQKLQFGSSSNLKSSQASYSTNQYYQSTNYNQTSNQSNQINQSPNKFNQSSNQFNQSSNQFNQSSNQFNQSSNQFIQSQIRSRTNISTSQVSDSGVRQFYKGLGCLPQQRLKTIAQGFLKIYGSGGQVRRMDLQKIQQIAHSQDSTRFQQSSQTVQGLQEVMDENKDKRVTQQDIYRLCERYLNCQKKAIIYTPMVQQRLSVARRLFKQFDVQKKGFLTQRQVPNLLSQTYRTLGRDFKATQDDIRSWMKLADIDGDGHVTLVQYEGSIIRALKKQGIKIYQD